MTHLLQSVWAILLKATKGCALAFILTFNSISAVAGNMPQADQNASSPIRVMSFNIRYGTADDGESRWELRKEFLAETIEAFNPDLLGSQETLLDQKNFLDHRLAGYQSLGVGRDDGQSRGEMTALWYRTDRFRLVDSGHFWLSETPDRPGSISWDSALTRMVSWVKLSDKDQPDAPPILFLNTHFDHVGQKARVESIKLLLKQIETLGPGCSIILTGDFNAGENSEPYRALFQPTVQENHQHDQQIDQQRKINRTKLIDTFRHVHPQTMKDEGTFSGFQANRTSGTRIDWIAVSGDWKVIASAIDRSSRQGRTPSDHFPVTAILQRVADPQGDHRN